MYDVFTHRIMCPRGIVHFYMCVCYNLLDLDDGYIIQITYTLILYTMKPSVVPTHVQVFRHPDFIDARIEFVSGEVGEGGDHANITLKNVSEAEVGRIIYVLIVVNPVVRIRIGSDPSYLFLKQLFPQDRQVCRKYPNQVNVGSESCLFKIGVPDPVKKSRIFLCHCVLCT